MLGIDGCVSLPIQPVSAYIEERVDHKCHLCKQRRGRDGERWYDVIV